MDAVLIQRVNLLYQQLSILQEFIEHKFGSEYKDFEQFKLSGSTSPTKNEAPFENDEPLENHLVEDTSPWGESTTITDGIVFMDEDDVQVKIEIPQSEDDSQEYQIITWDPFINGDVDETTSSPQTSLGSPLPQEEGHTFLVGHGAVPRPQKSPPSAAAASKKSRHRSSNKRPSIKGSCDYCGAKNSRSAAHILEHHREFCVITEGTDGKEVVTGYLCPREHCSRRGRPLYNHYQVEVHLKWPCQEMITKREGD